MKTWTAIVFLALITAAVIPGQDIDLQIAVATQEMNRETLERLGVSDDGIAEILRLQDRFRTMREDTVIEMNLVKAQLARQLHYADANSNEIGRLLEKASELRLEQERARVETYLALRNLLGEEKWNRLVLQIRQQVRQRLQDREDDANLQRTQSRAQDGGSSSAGSGNGNSSGTGPSSGGSGRR